MITINELADKHNYLSDIPYIFDSNIWEYDISQANINTLRAYNRISEEEYNRLSIAPKIEREITIGNWIKKDPSIQSDIYRGIAIAKYKLLNQYGISPDRVLRIANDAVYIINPKNITNNNYIDIDINGSSNVTFRLKCCYSFYMNLKSNNVLFFFGFGDTNNYDVSIIGINDNKLYLHNYFITFICDIINAYTYGGKSTALSIFNNFYNDFINRRLSIEYYREFNSRSCYRLNTSYEYFLLDNIDPKYVDKINIDCNLNILRTIYSYLIAS